MTSDEALDVLADEVTRAVLHEVIDNGLLGTCIDAELSDEHSTALRDRPSARIAGGPRAVKLSNALRALVEVRRRQGRRPLTR